MKKTLFFFILLIAWPMHVYSEATSDIEWKKRIDECKIRYGDRFKCNNNLFRIFSSTPYPKFGLTCRIQDMSTAEMKEKYLKRVRVQRTKCNIPGKGWSGLKPLPYVGAKSFLKQFENPEVQKLLPPGFHKAVQELKQAVAKGYLEDEGQRHGTFWLHPGEGIVSLGVPVDYSKHKLFKAYHFLISFENANLLSELIISK